MQECFRRHPDHYGGEFDDGDGQNDEAENSASNNPLVDEASTSPVLDLASSKNPEVDEPSMPLNQSKTPSSALSSPQADDPSVTPTTSSVSEGSQTTTDLSRKAPEATKGQDRGLRTLEPYQKSEGGERPVPDANHDSVPPS